MTSSPSYPFGVLDPVLTALVQLPTKVSTLGCSIRTDGQTLDFPNNFGINSVGPASLSTVQNGTYLFIWTITGTAEASGSAMVLPTITCGTNGVFLAAFSNNGVGGTTTTATPLATPQSGITVSATAASDSLLLTCMAMVQWGNVVPQAAGQTFIKLAGSGAHWPTSVTAGDVFVLEVPSSWNSSNIAPWLVMKQRAEKAVIAEKKARKEDRVAALYASVFKQMLEKGIEDSDSEDDEVMETPPKEREERKEPPEGLLSPKKKVATREADEDYVRLSLGGRSKSKS